MRGSQDADKGEKLLDNAAQEAAGNASLSKKKSGSYHKGTVAWVHAASETFIRSVAAGTASYLYFTCDAAVKQGTLLFDMCKDASFLPLDIALCTDTLMSAGRTVRAIRNGQKADAAWNGVATVVTGGATVADTALRAHGKVLLEPATRLAIAAGWFGSRALEGAARTVIGCISPKAGK